VLEIVKKVEAALVAALFFVGAPPTNSIIDGSDTSKL
jgi:hypothetical protein